MRRWETTGLIATFLLALALPFYLWHNQQWPQKLPPPVSATFVGRKACVKCHPRQEREFAESDHDLAMAVASDKTVLGDFNDATCTFHGVTSRFFRKEGKFFVHTAGVGGKMQDFEITHTFGWRPLQQYLIPFPDGRLQCLPLAWDVKKKKWFHLYPDNNFAPDDWQYWTNRAQTWNSMCADCHSTNFKKGYDFKKDTYNSSYAEINVSCEACHGPASRHVTWAQTMQPLDSDNGLLVHTGKMTARQQVELCAFCHSRRSLLQDYSYGKKELLDVLSPRLLDQGLYYADGQILDEVYVYNSFIQSKMFNHDIRCSDCHNIHSLKLHREGNLTCLQCHQADIYDSYQHHFHKKKGDASGKPIKAADGSTRFAVGSGALCVECHMPGKIYMGNDYRPDHSLRIPRPDLNQKLGSPDACRRCHYDKPAKWALDFQHKWYGEKQPYHYGLALAAGRKNEPGAGKKLIEVVENQLYPLNVRATALELAGSYQGEAIKTLFAKYCDSDEAIMRQTAVTFMPPLSPELRVKLTGPLLSDPVKGVRLAAARDLTLIPRTALDPKYHKAHDKALAELQKTLEYSADFADSRMNLGSFYLYRGAADKAEAAYKKAIVIDRELEAAYSNLALLYSRRQKLDQAEAILRRALAVDDNFYNIHYSLGLLLAEKRKYAEAVRHLNQAAAGLSRHARIYYNLGQLLAFMKKSPEAEKALTRALDLEPQNRQYQEALARLYLNQNQRTKAIELAEKLLAADPDHELGRQILKYLNQ